MPLKANFSGLNKSEKPLLALSGGVDSVVLFHLLIENNISFEAAHVNFKLRGEDSEEDQFFIESLCDKSNVKLHLSTCHTKDFAKKSKVSIQMAARNFRYDYFYTLQKEYGLSQLITAHHLEDQLESFLINLSRGSGIKGLHGIPNDKIIRPLLNASKDEIIAYAKQNKLIWREDKSNADNKYLRNFIRNQVVYPWKKKSENLLSGFKKSIDFLEKDYTILLKYHQNSFTNLLENTSTKEKRIKREALSKHKDDEHQLFWWFHPFGFNHPVEITKIISSQKGKEIFSKTHRLISDKAHLILVEKSDSPKNIRIIHQPKDFEILGWKYKKSTGLDASSDASFDLNKLSFPLEVRLLKKSDTISPFGMKGSKKAVKILNELGKSKTEKENQMVLVNNNGEIIWLVNERISNNFRIEPDTKEVINLWT